MNEKVAPTSLQFYKALQALKPSAPFNGVYFTHLEIKQFKSLLNDNKASPGLYDMALSYNHLDPDVYISRLAIIRPNKKILQTVTKIVNMKPELLEDPVHYYLAQGTPQMQCFEGQGSFYRVILAMGDQLHKAMSPSPFNLPQP